MPSELRKDYIQDRYVIISPGRKNRPHDVERPECLNPQPKSDSVFIPEKIDSVRALLTIGPKNDWYVKVLPNKFPIVSSDNPKAYGKHEVVVETPNPITQFEDLPEEHIVKIFEAYAHRIREIKKDPKIDYIIAFKNNGGKAGASIYHSHSQIFGTAFVPPHISDKSQRLQAYLLEHGRSMYLDIIDRELTGPRFVYQDHLVVAFCPYASFHNYEVWVMTKRQVESITKTTTEERIAIARIMKKLTSAIGGLHLPYNFYLHEIVHDKNHHLYIKIKPRGNVWAAVEIGSGIIINAVAPEEAAKYYREHL